MENDNYLEAAYEERTELPEDNYDCLGDDVSEHDDEPETEDTEHDGDNLSDVEADAMTLASAGMGTDEDYEHHLCDEGSYDNEW